MSSYYSSMVWANQTQKSMSRHWNLNTYFELSYVLITLLIHGGSLHHIWFHEKCNLMNIDIFQSIIKKEDHTIHIQNVEQSRPPSKLLLAFYRSSWLAVLCKGLRPATLFKKWPWHRCFSENFAKFLRTPLLKEHLRWLLLFLIWSIFTRFLVHKVVDNRSSD